MKRRDYYLNQLVAFRDKPLIKVITGIRRCGKSTLLSLFEQHLLDVAGVSPNQIIRINFESIGFDDITTYKALYQLVLSRMTNRSQRYYVLLDEVQQVPAWERAVNSLLVDCEVDIYITGSNAYLLSSELSTLLTGRYVEIKMQPLSFGEYVDFHDAAATHNTEALFSAYLRYGGLPLVVELKERPETIAPFLSGIYNTVIMKDVIQRNQVRDSSLLESVVKFIAANVGSIVSTKKISDYLTSSGRKTTSETIDNYLSMLENAFIIYRANRYDLRGKLFLKTLEKYYMVDTGIRNHLTGFRNTDYGHVLENVVYMELLRRGFEVSIGKVDQYEVDFVATKADTKIYYQVAATVMDESTRMRELRPLQVIADNYPKVILSMDKHIFSDFDGIRCVNIVDFLLLAPGTEG
ncbi:MAG: hypothetical protein DDT39_01418 [Firmicutes bacterium]|nr:hypothetical protein [candidate division NPL-UPA2 bacterium]